MLLIMINIDLDGFFNHMDPKHNLLTSSFSLACKITCEFALRC